VTIQKTDLEAEWGDDIAGCKPQEIMLQQMVRFGWLSINYKSRHKKLEAAKPHYHYYLYWYLLWIPLCTVIHRAGGRKSVGKIAHPSRLYLPPRSAFWLIISLSLNPGASLGVLVRLRSLRSIYMVVCWGRAGWGDSSRAMISPQYLQHHSTLRGHVTMIKLLLKILSISFDLRKRNKILRPRASTIWIRREWCWGRRESRASSSPRILILKHATYIVVSLVIKI